MSALANAVTKGDSGLGSSKYCVLTNTQTGYETSLPLQKQTLLTGHLDYRPVPVGAPLCEVPNQQRCCKTSWLHGSWRLLYEQARPGYATYPELAATQFVQTSRPECAASGWSTGTTDLASTDTPSTRIKFYGTAVIWNQLIRNKLIMQVAWL